LWWFIGIIWWFANIWVEACYGWSCTNQSIFLVDLIHLGAYKMFELDIYAYVACYEMFEWIFCLVIKFELVWMDKFIRWLLVSGLNGYMSYEIIQISRFQVWFNLKKNSSCEESCSIFEKPS
jgi:hypothetical protein